MREKRRKKGKENWRGEIQKGARGGGSPERVGVANGSQGHQEPRGAWKRNQKGCAHGVAEELLTKQSREHHLAVHNGRNLLLW